jgi:YidC/Oxa1 family membrane protein insertase
MDRKSILIIVLCFVVMALWNFLLVPKLYPPKPLPPRPTNAPPVALAATNQPIPPPPPPTPEAPVAPAPQLVASTNVPEQLRELTHENVRYTFTSHGGGLKQVEIFEASSGRRDQTASTNPITILNRFSPAPTLALLDGEALQGDGIFTLTKTADGLRAEKSLTNGLTIIKEFQPGSNYLLNATVRLENHSAKPLALPPQEWFVGTATPVGPQDDARALAIVGVLWYNGAKSEDVSASSYFSAGGGCSAAGCSQRIPPLEYRGGSNNVVWAAAHNQYFALAAMPKTPAQSLVIRRIDLPRFVTNTLAATAPPPQGYASSLLYPGLSLAPNQTLTNQINLYAGPKEYQTLARVSDRLGNNLELVMNFGWAGFVSKALLLGMNWFHFTLRLPYGWAIVVITFLIKLVFWPLTQASTRSMKRMQALQPQMNAIKEKYKDDPMKMNKKTMEFMRENKVNPLGGCLPMALQIPVFFGFYSMIQSAIELRGARFLWVPDLSRTDTLFVIPGLSFIPFFSTPEGLPFNLLPLIMGATMLWQSHLTPASPGMDPVQQKMMRYMPLMFLGFLYNYSAGLTLYWTVQNLLTILQTKLTRANPQPAPAPAPKAPLLTPHQKKRK